MSLLKRLGFSVGFSVVDARLSGGGIVRPRPAGAGGAVELVIGLEGRRKLMVLGRKLRKDLG